MIKILAGLIISNVNTVDLLLEIPIQDLFCMASEKPSTIPTYAPSGTPFNSPSNFYIPFLYNKPTISDSWDPSQQPSFDPSQTPRNKPTVPPSYAIWGALRESKQCYFILSILSSSKGIYSPTMPNKSSLCHHFTNDEYLNMNNFNKLCCESVFMIHTMCDKDVIWTHNKYCQHNLFFTGNG